MSEGRRRVPWARLVSLTASIGLLALLYRSLDVRLVAETLLRADRWWLAGSVALILPITAIRALRFFRVTPAGALPGPLEALRLTFVASALNLFAPAKSGDLVKSYFVARRGETTSGIAVAIVVYERLCDLFGLFAWCTVAWLAERPQVPGVPAALWAIVAALAAVLGVLVSSRRASALVPAAAARLFPHRRLRRVRQLASGWRDLLRGLDGHRREVVALSLVLWAAHLLQIWLFTVALRLQVPIGACVSLAALALLAGQLPFTVAGLGARDVALVVLLGRYAAPESAAALGLLIATRNLLPPLLGIAMVPPYLTSVLGEARRWRRGLEQAR